MITNKYSKLNQVWVGLDDNRVSSLDIKNSFLLSFESGMNSFLDLNLDINNMSHSIYKLI